jgi:hypothetical protein
MLLTDGLQEAVCSLHLWASLQAAALAALSAHAEASLHV